MSITTQSLCETMESQVRLYSRSVPDIFTTAKGAEMVSDKGRVYLDFLCGAGALNYGHNHDYIKSRLVDHLIGDGLVHGLDLFTEVKREFLDRLRTVLLEPRCLEYRVQFTGPTGANAIEAALKCARRVTERPGLVAFAGGFHGMSQGALSVSGALAGRRAAGVPSQEVVFVPYEHGPLGEFDSIGYLSRLLDDPASGLGRPAAVVVEAIQMDGGVYVASDRWLRELREFTRKNGILLICDEIQTGCGRTGDFFCFERASIVPDMVTASKSLSGYGLPLSILLLHPDLDVWAPGEHTGTFRANQLALVAATAALELWQNDEFIANAREVASTLTAFGDEIAGTWPEVGVRGAGCVLGLDVGRTGGGARAVDIRRRCYEDGLILETCGREGEVVKVMPPLTIDAERLAAGLVILRNAVRRSATFTNGTEGSSVAG